MQEFRGPEDLGSEEKRRSCKAPPRWDRGRAGYQAQLRGAGRSQARSAGSLQAGDTPTRHPGVHRGDPTRSSRTPQLRSARRAEPLPQVLRDGDPRCPPLAGMVSPAARRFKRGVVHWEHPAGERGPGDQGLRPLTSFCGGLGTTPGGRWARWGREGGAGAARGVFPACAPRVPPPEVTPGHRAEELARGARSRQANETCR